MDNQKFDLAEKVEVRLSCCGPGNEHIFITKIAIIDTNDGHQSYAIELPEDLNPKCHGYICDQNDFDLYKRYNNRYSYLEDIVGKFLAWPLNSEIFKIQKSQKDDTGMFCIECYYYNKYAEKNHKDGYLCYNCRKDYGWKYY